MWLISNYFFQFLLSTKERCKQHFKTIKHSFSLKYVYTEFSEFSSLQSLRILNSFIWRPFKQPAWSNFTCAFILIFELKPIEQNEHLTVFSYVMPDDPKNATKKTRLILSLTTIIKFILPLLNTHLQRHGCFESFVTKTTQKRIIHVMHKFNMFA